MKQHLNITNAHNGSIHALTFSTSENYLLSGGQDRFVHLWNASNGTKINSYLLHRYEILDLSISPDDSIFASVGGDRTAYVWDAQVGETVARFTGHTARINSCDFNDTASVLATGSFDKSVCIWDCIGRSKTPIQVLNDATDGISSVSFQGHFLASGSVDGFVRLYDIRMGQLKSLSMNVPVTSVSLALNGQSMIVSTLDSTIRLISSDTGDLIQTLTGHLNKHLRIPSRFCFLDKYITSGSEDNNIYVWEKGSETRHVMQHTINSLNQTYSSHALAAGKQQFIVASACVGDIVVWK